MQTFLYAIPQIMFSLFFSNSKIIMLMIKYPNIQTKNQSLAEVRIKNLK